MFLNLNEIISLIVISVILGYIFSGFIQRPRKEFEFRRWAFFFKEFKEKNNGKPPSQIAKDSFEKTLATLKQYYHKSYKKNDDV